MFYVLIGVGYLAATAFAVFSLICNFLYARTLGATAEEQALFIGMSLCIDAWKIIGLVLAGLLLSRGMRGLAAVAAVVWAVCFAWAYVAAIGFAVMTQTAATASKGGAETDRAALAREVSKLETKIQELPAHRPAAIVAALDPAAGVPIATWRATKSCFDITKQESIAACAPAVALRAEIAAAGEAARLEKMLEAAQSRFAEKGGHAAHAAPPNALANAIALRAGADLETVQLAIAFAFATIVELGSGLGFPIVSGAAKRTGATARQTVPRTDGLERPATDRLVCPPTDTLVCPHPVQKRSTPAMVSAGPAPKPLRKPAPLAGLALPSPDLHRLLCDLAAGKAELDGATVDAMGQIVTPLGVLARASGVTKTSIHRRLKALAAAGRVEISSTPTAMKIKPVFSA